MIDCDNKGCSLYTWGSCASRIDGNCKRRIIPSSEQTASAPVESLSTGSVSLEEYRRLKEREKKCPTMLESEARALVRALQEIRDELGMMECASPKQIVEAVRRLKQNN